MLDQALFVSHVYRRITSNSPSIWGKPKTYLSIVRTTPLELLLLFLSALAPDGFFFFFLLVSGMMVGVSPSSKIVVIPDSKAVTRRLAPSRAPPGPLHA